MKKIIITMFMILLMAGTVMAASSKATVSVTVMSQNETKEATQEKIQSKDMIHVENNVKGLENAQLQVRNEETKRKLVQVMEKIQEKRKEQLNKLEGLKIAEQADSSFEAVGIQQANLLGIIPIKVQEKYQIMEDGLIKHKPGALSFLWTRKVMIEGE